MRIEAEQSYSVTLRCGCGMNVTHFSDKKFSAAEIKKLQVAFGKSHEHEGGDK